MEQQAGADPSETPAAPQPEAATEAAAAAATADAGGEAAAAAGSTTAAAEEPPAKADDNAAAAEGPSKDTAEDTSKDAAEDTSKDAAEDTKLATASGTKRPKSAKSLRVDTSFGTGRPPSRPHTARISRRRAQTPGPGSYDPSPEKQRHTFPKYSFGGSNKGKLGRSLPIEAAKSGEPGPGASDPKTDTVKHKSPTWTLYPSARPPANVPQTACSPKVGPGAYDPKKETYRSPHYSIPSKGIPPVRANGYHWLCVGTTKPYKGRELEHGPLGAALALRLADKAAVLLRDEPVPPPGRLVDAEGLLREKPLVMEEPSREAQLSDSSKPKSIKLAEPEWAQFQIASHQLYTDHYVKVQAADPNKPEGSKLAASRPTFAYFVPAGPLKPAEGVEAGSLFTTGPFLNPEASLAEWAGANPKIAMPSESAKRRLSIRSGLSMAQVANFFKKRAGGKGAKPGQGLSQSLPAGAVAGDLNALGEGGEGGEAGASSAVVPSTGADGFKENLDGALNVDWKALSEKLPTGKDDASKQRRKALWKRADPNGNGYLSLAEVDLMVRDSVGSAMFSAKPAIAAAFHAARKSGGGKQEGRAADYVEWKEFRKLFVMLRQYYEVREGGRSEERELAACVRALRSRPPWSL